jgi:hypothetical protein
MSLIANLFAHTKDTGSTLQCTESRDIAILMVCGGFAGAKQLTTVFPTKEALTTSNPKRQNIAFGVSLLFTAYVILISVVSSL